MFQVPYIYPNLVLNENIAIVGSSGNLLNNNFGQEIDSYDSVIRFNRAPSKNYEQYVGSKTTLRVVNNHCFNNNDLSKEGWTDQPKDFVKNLRDTNILYFAPDIVPYLNREQNTHSSNEVYLFDYNNGVPNMFYGFKLGKNPTVGVGMILLCVMANVVPVCYGFDVENDCGRTHYFAATRPPPSTSHGIAREKQLLQELRNDGRIVLK